MFRIGDVRLALVKVQGWVGIVFVFAVLVLATPMQVHAQEGDTPRSVSIGLYESPPFVMPDTGEPPTGMAVELWEQLADRLNLASEYAFYPTLRELRDALESGVIDVAVTNLTITHERAKFVDFTQPWYDSGLRIMVHAESSKGFGAIIEGLSSAGHLRAYGWLALIIVVSTVLLTLFDRKFDKEFHSRWRDGVAKSFHSVMSVATTGRIPSRKNLFGWVGTVLSAFWLVCGIAVLAYVTSTVTSVMTTLAITNAISGPDDLPGKRIGVTSGSTAEEFARGAGLDIQTFDSTRHGVEGLELGEIVALVGDAPVLEYYAHTVPEQDVDVVGQLFAPEKYGFALSRDNPLTKTLTIEILLFKEDGTLEALDTKYFGSVW